MEKQKTFLKFIYHTFVRPSRLRKEAKIINQLPGKTILEIGYFDESFKKLLHQALLYTGIDPFPTKHIKGMPKVTIEDYVPQDKFDIVVVSNVLEHLSDPVLVIKKIRSLAKEYIFISIPYEPWYTVTRFGIPEKEHYWTIHSNLLKYYFGVPVQEKYFHCRRTYCAVFQVPFSKN